jgi:CHAT domain-containing protein/tetratricopeptide (TPR) repeat protein
MNEIDKLIYLGDYGRALELALRLRGEARGRGARAAEAACLRSICRCRRSLGDYEEALAAAKEACEATLPGRGDAEDLGGHLRSLVELARAYLALNKPADAMEVLDRGLLLDRTRNGRRAYRLLAETASDVYVQSGFYTYGEFMSHRADRAGSERPSEPRAPEKYLIVSSLMLRAGPDRAPPVRDGRGDGGEGEDAAGNEADGPAGVDGPGEAQGDPGARGPGDIEGGPAEGGVDPDEGASRLAAGEVPARIDGAGDSEPSLPPDPELSRWAALRKIRLARVAELKRQYAKALYLLDGTFLETDESFLFSRQTDPDYYPPQAGELDPLILLGEGRIRLALGEAGLAMRRLSAAVTLGRDRGDVVVEMLGEEQLGLLALRGGDVDGALSHFRRSIELLEGGLSRLRVEEWHASLRATADSVYAQAINACAVADRPQDAWEFSERARAQFFLRLVANAGLLARMPRAGALGLEYEDVSRRLASVTEQVIGEYRAGRGSSALGLRSLAEQLRERQAALVRDLLRESPLDASLAGSPVTPAPELQAAIGERVGVIEYFVDDDRLHLLFLGHTELVHRTVGVGRESLARLVIKLRGLITAAGRGAGEAEGPLMELSETLYRLLLGPFDELLDRCESVYILAHDILQQLPFSALTREGIYLCERVRVMHAPSGSILHTLLGASAGPSGGAEATKLVAFVNTGSPIRSAELPYANQEALTLEQVLGGFQVFRDERATVGRFLTEAPDSRVIHLACHAAFDPEHPLMSHLRLAANVAGKGDSGELAVHTILTVRLRAALVVLSGCGTGLSGLSSGNEFTGLVRAFITAGARSVIASQWDVSDLSTSLLIAHFYGAWGVERLAPAEALREAQRRLRTATKADLAGYWGRIYEASGGNDPASFRAMRYYRAHTAARPCAHPYHWAGFSYYGA